jgi:ketosteroid isomerase-like protein
MNLATRGRRWDLSILLQRVQNEAIESVKFDHFAGLSNDVRLDANTKLDLLESADFAIQPEANRMPNPTSVAIVLECFEAVEQRDEERQKELFHPEVEFHWPPNLLQQRGLEAEHGGRQSFQEVWDPFQPTEAERRMDPRVVAASENEVVVLWQQRGVDTAGERFESPVLGIYEVREQRLVRAQMFYFDAFGTADFLRREREGKECA